MNSPVGQKSHSKQNPIGILPKSSSSSQKHTKPSDALVHPQSNGEFNGNSSNKTMMANPAVAQSPQSQWQILFLLRRMAPAVAAAAQYTQSRSANHKNQTASTLATAIRWFSEETPEIDDLRCTFDALFVDTFAFTNLPTGSVIRLSGCRYWCVRSSLLSTLLLRTCQKSA